MKASVLVFDFVVRKLRAIRMLLQRSGIIFNLSTFQLWVLFPLSVRTYISVLSFQYYQLSGICFKSNKFLTEISYFKFDSVWFYHGGGGDGGGGGDDTNNNVIM